MDRPGPLKVNEWGAYHVFAMAEQPKTSRLVKRTNGTIPPTLSAFIYMDHDDVDCHLPAEVFDVSTVRKSNVNISPFQLMHGRLPFTSSKNQFQWPKECPKAFNVFFARFSELREAARLIKSKHLVDLRQRVVQDFYPGALLLIRRKLNQS